MEKRQPMAKHWTAYYEIHPGPQPQTSLYYAVNHWGQKTIVSYAAILKARQRGKIVHDFRPESKRSTRPNER